MKTRLRCNLQMEKDAAVGSVVFGAADCADFADAALQGAVAFLTQCLRRKNLRNPRNLRLTRRGNALEIRIRKGYFLRLLNVFWKSGNSCFPFSLSPK
jgi:hypothetical protein